MITEAQALKNIYIRNTKSTYLMTIITIMCVLSVALVILPIAWPEINAFTNATIYTTVIPPTIAPVKTFYYMSLCLNMAIGLGAVILIYHMVLQTNFIIQPNLIRFIHIFAPFIILALTVTCTSAILSILTYQNTFRTLAIESSLLVLYLALFAAAVYLIYTISSIRIRTSIAITNLSMRGYRANNNPYSTFVPSAPTILPISNQSSMHRGDSDMTIYEDIEDNVSENIPYIDEEGSNYDLRLSTTIV